VTVWWRRFTHSDWLRAKHKQFRWLARTVIFANHRTTNYQSLPVRRLGAWAWQLLFGDWSRTKSCAWTRASLPVRKPDAFWREIVTVHLYKLRTHRAKNYFSLEERFFSGIYKIRRKIITLYDLAKRKFCLAIIGIIIYMTKLLQSDWLRGVQLFH
jgi:hypothetical protein